VGGFGQQRDRVRHVTAGGLDDREAAENQQRDEEATLTDVTRVAVRPMAMPVLVSVSRVRTVVRVVVIAVMLVRVRHEFGKPGFEVYT
jgi:hypothetical protein